MMWKKSFDVDLTEAMPVGTVSQNYSKNWKKGEGEALTSAKEEFDWEMLEAIKKELLDLTQKLGDKKHYDDVMLLVRTIRFITEIQREDRP